MIHYDLHSYIFPKCHDLLILMTVNEIQYLYVKDTQENLQNVPFIISCHLYTG